MTGRDEEGQEQGPPEEDVPLPAVVTLLTTEHYNLQTQRASTIGEANGRASVFLGALSAGLIAIGFRGGSAGRATGTITFEVLVLSCLCFLGSVTFIRCVELAIDDWLFYTRISALRMRYAGLAPSDAELLRSVAETEQAAVMLTPRRRVLQLLLTVAGSIGVLTGVLAGADVGILAYGLRATFVQSMTTGAAVGLAVIVTCDRFQRARWKGAIPLP